MTPLDCALQRGFRSTAKFLQLHGGIPASKLVNPQKIGNLSSTINMNIKDNVTLLGDSSDDERENTDIPNADRKKRSYKKKHKNEKDDSGKRSRTIRVKGTTSDEVLRYSSEVIVSDDKNGTINIEQNGEIVLSEQKEKQATIKSKIPVATIESKNEIKEKRPKSAKRTKTTSKSKTISGSEKEVDSKAKANKKSEEFEKQTSTTTSTQESSDTKVSVETVVENGTLKTQEKDIGQVVSKTDSLVPQKTESQSKKDADKQSLLSSTSVEEGEKQVVVEAHVHSPPKSASNEVTIDKEEKEIVAVDVVGTKTAEVATAEVEENNKQIENIENTILNVSNGTTAAIEPSKEYVIKEAEKIPHEEQVTETETKTDGKSTSIEKTEEAPKESNTENEIVEVTESIETGINATEIADEKTSETSAKETVIDNTTVEQSDAETAKVESGSQEVKKEIQKKKQLTKQATISIAPGNALEEVADSVGVEADKVKSVIEESITAAKEELKEEVSTVEQEVAVGKENILQEITAATEDVSKIVENAKEDIETEIIEVKENVTSAVGKVEQGLVEATTTVTKIATGDIADEVEEHLLQALETENITGKNETTTHDNKVSETKTAGKDEDVPRKIRAVDTGKSIKSKKTKTPVQKVEDKSKKKQFLKPKPHKPEAQYDASVEMKSSEEESTSPSSSSKEIKKEHKSFKILDDTEELPKRRIRSKSQVRKTKPKIPLTKERSKSEESNRDRRRPRDTEKFKRSKIPTPIRDLKPRLSKSDRYLDRSSENRIPILSDLRQGFNQLRSESSMTAPIHTSAYSDNERGTSGSDMEEMLSSATRRKRLKKREKTRESKSAGSDYESSNLIDSGFEPSPRSSRLPKWKNMSERGVDMSSVTQTIQSNIRR